VRGDADACAGAMAGACRTHVGDKRCGGGERESDGRTQRRPRKGRKYFGSSMVSYQIHGGSVLFCVKDFHFYR